MKRGELPAALGAASWKAVGGRRLEEDVEEQRRRARCVECDRPIGPSGAWYVDDAGLAHPFCRACAGLDFPLT